MGLREWNPDSRELSHPISQTETETRAARIEAELFVRNERPGAYADVGTQMVL